MVKKVLSEKWVRWSALIAALIVVGLFLYGKGYNDKRDEVVKAFSKIGNTTKDIKNTSDDVEENFEDLGTVNVGEIASYGNLNFKVTGATVCEEIKGHFGSADKPELGQFVVVDLEGENIGNSVEDFYCTNFRLADDKGHDYETDLGSSVSAQKKYHTTWGDAFKPGGKKKFRLSFDVPKGDISVYKIQIKYNNGIQYMALA